MTKPTVDYLMNQAVKYFRGPKKKFKVQRVGLRAKGSPYYVVTDLSDPNPRTAVARVPEEVFLEWQQRLVDSRSASRSFRSLYKYTEAGNMEYRMNMYQNFMVLINFSSSLSEQQMNRLNALIKDLSVEQWERLTRKRPDLFEEIWNKYDLYEKEAIETGKRKQTLKDADFEKLVEELERIVK